MLESVDKLCYAIFGAPWYLDVFLPQWDRVKEGTELATAIKDILSTLTPREERVIQLRFGIGTEDGRGLTHEQAGKVFNVTRERIRQIEAKALRKLRHPSKSRGLNLFQPSMLIAKARYELWQKLSDLYPKKVALVVASRVKSEDLSKASKSIAEALKSSCGTNISWCLYCEKPLPPGWNYCNVGCQRKHRIVRLVCDTCGKSFERDSSRLFRTKDGQKVGLQRSFCNQACFRNRGKGKFIYKRKSKEVTYVRGKGNQIQATAIQQRPEIRPVALLGIRIR